MSEQTPQNLPSLEYAARPRLAWVSRHRRWLIPMALCVGFAGSILWFWRPLSTRVRWLYWSHRAAIHVMPAGADVSVVGPQAATMPAGNPDYVPTSPYRFLASTQPSASYSPIAFRELVRLDGRFDSMPNRTGPVIFIGTVPRPDGTPRLLILTGGYERDSRNMLRTVGALVLPLPLWFDPLPPIPSTTAAPVIRLGGGSGRPPEPIVFLTGTIDSKDASHLIIPYMLLESYSAMVQRLRAAARAADPTAPDAALPATVQTQMAQATAQGELDVYLQNDDSLRFTVRGPGQLPTTTLAADPQSLRRAAGASQPTPSTAIRGPTPAR